MRKRYAAIALGFLLILSEAPPVLAAGADDLYTPFLTETAPHISSLVEAEHEESGVLVKRVIFRADDEADIDLIYACPKEEGRYPGVLVLHGGGGIADRAGAVRWAQAGYTAVAVDIPGLLDVDGITHTSGAFLDSETRFDSVDQPKSNPLYHAMASVLGGFRILAKHKKADPARLGISAKGWGADLAVLAAGLLGDRVAAVYLQSGAAALRYGSYFNDVSLSKNPDAAKWCELFDGLSVAGRVTAPVFAASEITERLFYPESIQKTLDTISGDTNQLFTAGSVPANAGIRFFDQVLKESGSVPKLTFTGIPVHSEGQWVFTAAAAGAVASMRLYYSDARAAAPFRAWSDVEGVERNGQYQFTIPEAVLDNACYFASASGPEGVLATTRIYSRLPGAGGGQPPWQLIQNGTFSEGTAFWRADCGAALAPDSSSLTIFPSGRFGSSAYQQVVLDGRTGYDLAFSARTDGPEQPIALVLQKFDPVSHRYGARTLFRPKQNMTGDWLEYTDSFTGLSGTYQVWFQAGDGTGTDAFSIRDVSLSYQPETAVTLTQEDGQLVARATVAQDAMNYLDAELLLAVYGKSGALISAVIAKPQWTGGVLTFEAAAAVPAVTGFTAKAFLWQNMRPLAECSEIG